MNALLGNAAHAMPLTEQLTDSPHGYDSPHAATRLRLSPRARTTLDRLLRAESSKEIAAAMGLSVHTVNQYVKTVFRAFGVRSRAELLSRWHGWR